MKKEFKSKKSIKKPNLIKKIKEKGKIPPKYGILVLKLSEISG